MTQPLALVVYENLLPGTQLINRLQDLGYRVHVVESPELLKKTAEETGPLLVFADLQSTRVTMLNVIAALKENAATAHLPVVAFGLDETEPTQKSPNYSGVTLIASQSMLTNHLSEVLEQALRVD